METYNVLLPTTPFIMIIHLCLICDFICRLLSVDCADFLVVDCADILLVDCAHFRHVTRSARRGRFAPAGLASRAPGLAVTL